jgi:hypothetical protein
MARIFNTDHLRVFDFWRIEDPAPYRAAIDQELRDAAAKAGTLGVTLVLENECACNTATAAESLRTLKAVPSTRLCWAAMSRQLREAGAMDS